MDSTGLHYILRLHYILVQIWTPLDCQLLLTQAWTPLDCPEHSTQNWTGLDWTGLHCYSQHKAGLHWTAHYSQHKPGLYWTPLDSTGFHWIPQLYLTQNWTPLDWTGLHCCRGLYSALLIPAGIQSFLRNPVDSGGMIFGRKACYFHHSSA